MKITTGYNTKESVLSSQRPITGTTILKSFTVTLNPSSLVFIDRV